ncbi:MAG: hypothetical protein HQ596_02130 [Candidatus Saganbacteria bacterium]|nr:hypothetical protein [Candidatus Saganbacteria bacterium]
MTAVNSRRPAIGPPPSLQFSARPWRQREGPRLVSEEIRKRGGSTSPTSLKVDLLTFCRTTRNLWDLLENPPVALGQIVTKATLTSLAKAVDKINWSLATRTSIEAQNEFLRPLLVHGEATDIGLFCELLNDTNLRTVLAVAWYRDVETDFFWAGDTRLSFSNNLATEAEARNFSTVRKILKELSNKTLARLFNLITGEPRKAPDAMQTGQLRLILHFIYQLRSEQSFMDTMLEVKPITCKRVYEACEAQAHLTGVKSAMKKGKDRLQTKQGPPVIEMFLA